MSRYWIAILLVWCNPCGLFAQSGAPDFSGVYLRSPLSLPNSASSKSKGKEKGAALLQMEKTLDEGSPLVLVVAQTGDGVRVTKIQNGASMADEFSFQPGTSAKNQPARSKGLARARIEKDSLELDYSMEQVSFLGSTVEQPIHETWRLSPDLGTLQIQSTLDGNQTFTRQASLDSALARAKKLSLADRCVCLRMPPGEPAPREYKEGVALGFTVYRQLQRIEIFDAGISGDIFKGLQRTETPNGPLFRKSGQPIETFPDDLTLEITFKARFSSGPYDQFGIVDAPIPAELSSLRFQARWVGSSPPDLGELPAELVTESGRSNARPGTFIGFHYPPAACPSRTALRFES